MAKHLSELEINKIIKLLDGWTGKLTWESLIEESSKTILGRKPARQTLFKNKRLRFAFEHRKRELKKGTKRPSTSLSKNILIDMNTRLKSEINRLNAELDLMMETFKVWQYNAYANGLSEDQLNKPLPSIDREPTNA